MAPLSVVLVYNVRICGGHWRHGSTYCCVCVQSENMCRGVEIWLHLLLCDCTTSEHVEGNRDRDPLIVVCVYNVRTCGVRWRHGSMYCCACVQCTNMWKGVEIWLHLLLCLCTT
jgi:hypothetical protein